MKLNEEIRAKEVRVTSSTNEQLGVMPLKEALRLAMEQNMDLVEVAPTAKPPVCRIMDYGKFKYEQQKRDKEVKKKQRTVVVKEVKVRPNIEDHDYEVKFRNAVRFLEDGDKVKLTVMFRGREVSHPELGKKVLDRMAAQLKSMDMVIVEREAKLEGKNMIMILSPKVHN